MTNKAYFDPESYLLAYKHFLKFASKSFIIIWDTYFLVSSTLNPFFRKKKRKIRCCCIQTNDEKNQIQTIKTLKVKSLHYSLWLKKSSITCDTPHVSYLNILTYFDTIL